MKPFLIASAVALISFGLSAQASANTIWTLNNITLHCGNCAVGGLDNTASGQFEVKADLSGLESWKVKIEGAFSGINYEYDSSIVGNSSIFWLSTSSFAFIAPGFTKYFDLTFSTPLTEVGSPTSIPLVAGSAGFGSSTFSCGPQGGGTPCGILSTAGTVDSTANGSATVPEPATMGLVAFGLAGAVSRKLRSRKR